MKKVIMTAYHTTAAGVEYKPGDVVAFDPAEADRQVKIGGARLPKDDDSADAKADAKAIAAFDVAAAEQAAAAAAAEVAAADAAGKGKK